MTKGPFIAVAVVLAVVCGFIGFKRGAAGADGILGLEQRLSAMESRQRAMEEVYLNGTRNSRQELAQRLGYHAASRNPVSAQGDWRKPLSPAEQRRSAQQIYDKLQQSFGAEPVNPAWAGKTRQNVDDVLYQIAQQGIVPQSSQIDCRSRSCMISLNLAGSGEIDALTESLLTDISANLPDTHMVEIPSADGSRVDLHIYATTMPASPGRPNRPGG